MSSIGKGTFISILTHLIQKRGFKVNLLKIDPYLNVDAGLLNPSEHGEVFVTEDGYECDNDIGVYHRYTNIQINKDNCITSGKIYQQVFENERKGYYNGKTVTHNPMIIDEIIKHLNKMR